MNGAVLSQETFQRFAELIYKESGITLGNHKHSLVAARLGKRMRILGFDSFEEYLAYVSHGDSSGELVLLLDAISTNVTNFYREAVHFEILSELLKTWRDRGQTRFRVWCAAASTGEEPYTLAMTLAEVLRDNADARILATDISTAVLATAAQGEYEAKKLESVPRELRERFFTPVNGATGKVYRVKDNLRRMLKFGRLNLATPPFPMRGPMDAVFCRNVMIYFDNRVRQGLVNEIYRLLRPGGYLMVGHSESLTGLGTKFRTVNPSVYVKD